MLTAPQLQHLLRAPLAPSSVGIPFQGLLTDLQRSLGNQVVARLVSPQPPLASSVVQRMPLGQAKRLMSLPTPMRVWAVDRTSGSGPVAVAVCIVAVHDSDETAEVAIWDDRNRRLSVPLADVHTTSAGAEEAIAPKEALPQQNVDQLATTAAASTSTLSFAEPLDASNVPEKVTQVIPLFKILSTAAEQLGVNVFELEMRVASPSSWIKSVPPDDQQLLSLNFKQLVQQFAIEKRLTNSCGQTSEWLPAHLS